MGKKDIEDSNDDFVGDEEVSKMTHIEHIKTLPDTYIGSVEKQNTFKWVIDNQCELNPELFDGNNDNDGETETSNNIEKQDQPSESLPPPQKYKITNKEIELSPGFSSIYEEILVNAFDNRSRILQKLANEPKLKLEKLTEIKVNIDKENGIISVYNNGEGIDVAKHVKEQIYIPELIFGHLLTSGNYRKKNKTTGGKNGYGAKLTNIYSEYFEVDTVDKKRKLRYVQLFEKNMTVKHDPKIEKYTGKPYTKITFKPDLKLFNMDTITNDVISLMKKRVVDMYACSDGDINVYFNDENIELNSFQEYMSLYLDYGTKTVVQKGNERWLIGATMSPNFMFQQVSFVNGINTSRGGKHVEYISEQICQKLIEYIHKKKKVQVKKHAIKENLMVFVISIIEDPSFDSQTKETLTTSKTKFGSVCNVGSKFIEELGETGIIERAISLSEYKDKQLLSKNDGKKSIKLIGIEKLHDAKLAGSVNSKKCTLILTEGDSAKTSAVSGLSVIENAEKYYGIFPLKGKPLNTRDATGKQIAENTEITNIKNIMGLKETENYESIDKLRYGRIMIMADQDHDGSHIKGLLINFLSRWPSLLKLKGFVTSLVTPIVKATKRKQVKKFYNMGDFETWSKNNNNCKGWNVKYYKGLGTSTPAEAKEYFREFKLIEYDWDEQAAEKLDLVFRKTRADDRKGWLTGYDKLNVLDICQSSITYSDFIDKDLIHFSNIDNERSIPNLCDGLKTGQRKVIFSCFKRKLDNEIKVAQLAGYVSEHSAYHHGEASLNGTIIGMAQDYVGSNNINLLEPNGQFGSRLEGGKDSSAPRYIFTKLTPITNILFNKLDEPLCKFLNEEGQDIEPEYYLPILPLSIINGSDGIGTGWSSKIPKFSVNDIIANIKLYLKEKPMKSLTPSYRGFKGTFTNIDIHSWICRGVYKLIGTDTIEVTELPVGVWTSNFKENLENLMTPIQKTPVKKGKNTKQPVKKKNTGIKQKYSETQIVKDFSCKFSESKVHFTIKLDYDILTDMLGEVDKYGVTKLETVLMLVKKFSCTEKQLTLYDEKCKLRSFTTIDNVLTYFCDLRVKLYQSRKDYLLPKYKTDLDVISAKTKFVLAIINGDIIVNNQSKAKIIEQLRKDNYPIMYNKSLITDLTKEEASQGNYDYLISMPIYNLTKDKIEELKKEKGEVEAKYKKLFDATPSELWLNDIGVFETEYTKFMKRYYEEKEYDPNDYIKTNKEAKKKLAIKKRETVTENKTKDNKVASNKSKDKSNVNKGIPSNKTKDKSNVNKGTPSNKNKDKSNVNKNTSVKAKNKASKIN